MNRTLRRSLNVLRVVATVAALVLLVLVMIDGLGSVELSRVRVAPLLLAFVGSVVAWLCFAASWSLLTTGRTTTAMFDWFTTQLYRYLPGGIWAPLARIGTVSGPRSKRVSAVGLEAVVMATSAAAAAAVLVSPRWPMALIGVTALAIPLATSGRILRANGASNSVLIKAQLMCSAGWIIFGSAGWAAQRGVGSEASGSDVLVVAGVSVVAWLAGYVVIVAPSGAGVREVAYLAMIGAVLSDDLGSAGVSLHRVIGVIVELVVVAAATFLMSRRRSRASREYGCLN